MTDRKKDFNIDPGQVARPKIDRQTGRIEFTDSYAEFMSSFQKEGEDVQDYVTEEERRQALEERRQQRKARQRRRRRIIAAGTVIVAVAVIAIFGLAQFNSAYDDESSFESFADSHFHKMHVLPQTKDRLVTYQYGDTVSFAYRYDPSGNEDLAVFRDQQVEELKKDFEKSVKKKIKEQGEKRGGFFHKDTNYAMLFDSAVYETGNGALSMAIYAVEYNEVDRKMEPVQSSVQTYLLNKDTMLQLNPMQLLTPDYKEKAAVFSAEYLNKNYKEEEIRPDADIYLKEDDSNYNQIVLSDGEMTVFFDEGTILDASQGVAAITVPKVYLGTSLRSKVITRYIDPDKPMVAITYDDGPGGEAETKILKTLKKYGAVATFFYVGNRVDYDQKNVKRAYEQGCEIANHSWDHADLTGLSAKGVKSQMRKTNKAIKEVIGVKPEIYRPPYGSYNDDVLEAADMPAIIWDVDTEDWRSRDAKAVFKVIKKTKKLDGKIILMHSIYDSTAAATKKIVPYLQKKGYQLVTVSELIKYKTGEAPKAGHTY